MSVFELLQLLVIPALGLSGLAWLGMAVAAVVRVRLGGLLMGGWLLVLLAAYGFAVVVPSPPLLSISFVGTLVFPVAVGWRIYRSRYPPLGADPGPPFGRGVVAAALFGVATPVLAAGVHTYLGFSFRISGKLIDDRGRAIPRAAVFVAECPVVGDAAAGCAARTAVDGRFSIPGSPYGEVHLNVLRGRDLERGLAVHAPSDGVVLRGHPLPFIRGVMRDAQGRPKSGGLLFLVPRGRGPGIQPILGTLQTEPDGSFFFDALDPGKYWVTVNPMSANMQGNWYAAATVPSDEEVHLGPPPLRISGRVRVGQGVERRAWMPAAQLLDEVPQGAASRIRGSMNAEGSFEIGPLQPGRYRVGLEAGAGGHEPVSNEVEVEGGAEGVVLEVGVNPPGESGAKDGGS